MATDLNPFEIAHFHSGFVVRPRELLARLLGRFDVGNDGRITADDVRRSRQGNFTLRLAPGVEVSLSGAERLSGLADLLGSEIRRGHGDHAVLPVSAFAPTRLEAALSLVGQSWDRLTQRCDTLPELVSAAHDGVLQSADGHAYIYVPSGDEATLTRLRADARRQSDVAIVPLPKHRGVKWQRRLEAQPGIVYLPRPYLVPGGIFREMYGWDSYFQARGALLDGRLSIARDVVDNFVYQVRHYGRIANTNRSHHLSRTQPPLLSALARLVFSELERSGDAEAVPFLRRATLAAEESLHDVWGRAPRSTSTGLARYHDDADGPCPEVEAMDPDFYVRHPRTLEYWRHDRALRESGWDLTHRFGEEAHLHLPVCLNALLYRTERDLAAMWRRLEGAGSSRARRFEALAQVRRRRVDRMLWSPSEGLYFDWSLRRHAQSPYESLATFYPLWVGMASGEQAARVAENVERFLAAGGLATTSRASRKQAPRERFQWDWPIGWAPLQIIAVEGLRRYGHHRLADTIAYRWLWMVLRVAGDGNGVIKEKYDVTARTPHVRIAEYANQGNDRGKYLDEAPATVGFGWTNASIPILLAGLEEPLQRKLDAGIRPSAAGC